MSWPLVAAMREQGVQVHLGVTIAKVKRTENCVTQVELTDGSVLDTDLIVSSIGVRPRVELAQAAGDEDWEYGRHYGRCFDAHK